MTISSDIAAARFQHTALADQGMVLDNSPAAFRPVSKFSPLQ
jgi:hypothetical protein